MRFSVPYPPSTNLLYRSVVKRFRGAMMAFPIKTKAYRDYESEIRRRFLEHRKNPYPADQLVGVNVHVYRPQRSGDLDGRLKAALDVIKGIAFEDDKQVIEIHAYRHDDKHDPRLTIEVWDVVEQPEENPLPLETAE